MEDREYRHTLRIKAWNFTDYQSEGEPVPNSDQIFDMTLDDEKQVHTLLRQFSALRLDVRAMHGPMLPGYRYEFTFKENDGLMRIYEGTSHAPLWRERIPRPPSNKNIANPISIVQALHESIGLPYELPLGHS